MERLGVTDGGTGVNDLTDRRCQVGLARVISLVVGVLLGLTMTLGGVSRESRSPLAGVKLRHRATESVGGLGQTLGLRVVGRALGSSCAQMGQCVLVGLLGIGLVLCGSLDGDAADLRADDRHALCALVV